MKKQKERKIYTVRHYDGNLCNQQQLEVAMTRTELKKSIERQMQDVQYRQTGPTKHMPDRA